MKDKLRLIADNFHKYNADNMCELAFGIDRSIVYDALVVAPSFSPYKLHMEDDCRVTLLKEGAYLAVAQGIDDRRGESGRMAASAAGSGTPAETD